MKLPPFPTPVPFMAAMGEHVYIKSLVREYGLACAEAMREACAKLIKQDIQPPSPFLTAYQGQYNKTIQHTAQAIKALEIEE